MNQKFNLNFENLVKISIFVIFLLPVSLQSGLSSNYLFVLYPLLLVLIRQKIVVPPIYLLSIILFYCFLFFLSFLIQIEWSHFHFRKLSSFFIFMTMFSFMFISINENQITAFKISIVLYSLFFIIPPILIYFFADPSSLDSNPKAQFGSQRYGFIYLMAFWIVFFYRLKKISWNLLLKYIVLVLLLIGILMTFSRSSVVSLFTSFFAYILFEIFYNKKSFNSRIKNFFTFIFASSLLFFLIYLYAPKLIQFFDSTLLSKLFEEGLDGFDLSNNNSSIGYRVYMLNQILDFVAVNPLTGSGYLGVWILFDELSGSAHNQYADVLFRVGVFGFLIYIFLIKRLVSFLYMNDKSLFYGFIAVLFYGLFHETFKLSHGGFLLSFLLALAFQKKNLKKALHF